MQEIPEENQAGVPIDSYEVNSAVFNRLAMFIITGVIIILMTCLFIVLINIKSPNYIPSLNFKLDSVHLSKLDSTFIIANKEFTLNFNRKIDSLIKETAELKEIKTKIEDTQRKNEDYFKLILALVGSVFAIVGFFGFKSISDTRQATLDAAKLKAETVAATSAEKQAEKTVKEYLDKDGNLVLTKTSTDVASAVAEKISYDNSTKVATAIAQDEVRKAFSQQQEFKKAFVDDLASLEKQNDTLRARIIELENKIFGSEPDPDKPATPPDTNPQADV